MLASRYCCVGYHKFTLVVIEWVFPYTTSPPIPILSFFLFWEVFKALLHMYHPPALWATQWYQTFSNFSCMFLNPNIFFQFEFKLFWFIRYSKASRYTASRCTDLDNARFWIGSKKIWDERIYVVKTLSCTYFWWSCLCIIN